MRFECASSALKVGLVRCIPSEIAASDVAQTPNVDYTGAMTTRHRLPRRSGSRGSRRATALIAAFVLGGVVACSPLPNPNPSSPANSLGGVGSPNQLQNGQSATP